MLNQSINQLESGPRVFHTEMILVSMAFVFWENRWRGTDGQTDGQGTTLNAVSYRVGRIQCWNWPERTRGVRCRNVCEILHRDKI